MNVKLSQMPLLAASLALASVFCVNTASAQTARTSADAHARYEADMQRCDTLKGNDKDICEKEAKAKRDMAKADAKAGKAKAEANHDAVQTKRDAAYDVAKEKCDAMSGDNKDQCIAKAKTQYGK